MIGSESDNRRLVSNFGRFYDQASDHYREGLDEITEVLRARSKLAPLPNGELRIMALARILEKNPHLGQIEEELGRYSPAQAIEIIVEEENQTGEDIFAQFQKPPTQRLVSAEIEEIVQKILAKDRARRPRRSRVIRKPPPQSKKEPHRPKPQEARRKKRYLRRKAAYQELRQEPEKNQLVEKALARKARAAIAAQMYFGEEPLTFVQIGKKFGFSPITARRSVRAFLHWSNIEKADPEESDFRAVISQVDQLRSALEPPQKITTPSKPSKRRQPSPSASKILEARKALIKNLQQETAHIPPETLTPRHHQVWQGLTKIAETVPERLEKLTPRQAQVLAQYYQIGPRRGEKTTFTAIGQRLGLSDISARRARTEALKILGIEPK
jgi:hypothetical protein